MQKYSINILNPNEFPIGTILTVNHKKEYVVVNNGKRNRWQEYTRHPGYEKYATQDNGFQPFTVFLNHKKKDVYVYRFSFDEILNRIDDNENTDILENHLEYFINDIDQAIDFDKYKKITKVRRLDNRQKRLIVDNIRDNICMASLEPVFHLTNLTKIFVGDDPMFDDEYEKCCGKRMGPDYTRGSSILLALSGGRYIFIGDSIYSFKSSDPIIKYHSRMGPNDVPYPVAESRDNLYMMSDKVYLSKKYFTNDNYLDAYGEYYGHTGKKEPLDKYAKKMSSVKVILPREL